MESKQTELSKLFDAVVAFQQDQENDFLKEVAQTQKHHCQILWPEETLHTAKQAMAYAEHFT